MDIAFTAIDYTNDLRQVMDHSTAVMDKIKLELLMKAEENMAGILREITSKTNEMLTKLKEEVVDEITKNFECEDA